MTKTTSLFKALSDPTRVSCLLLLLMEPELCVCELVKALGVPQPLVSRHLAQLRRLGIVEDDRRGQWVHYRLNPDLPEWALEVLAVVRRAEAESERMTKAQKRLSAIMPRPTPLLPSLGAR